MTKWRPRSKFWLLSGFIGVILCAAHTGSASEKTRQPTETELERLVGQKLERSIKSVKWQAGEPPKTNLLIYAVQPAVHQPEFLKSLAEFVGVHGELQKLPTTIIYSPGHWIKEPNPTNKETWKALIFSEISGMVRYDSGEDNHKWDLKNHKPLVHGVPDEAEALQRTLALLPALGITTNDLEHLPDGKLKNACNNEGTWFNDRHDNWQRKRYIRQINIELWQRIQDGASVLPIGTGGMLRAGYISEGHLAQLEITFRKVTPVGEALPKSSAELVQMLRRREGRSFHGRIPDKLTVTDCKLVYPEANSTTRQDLLWPFYALHAMSSEDGETNVLSIYMPISW